MLVDFNAQEERVFHGMNCGKGDVCATMYMNSSGKVIVSRLKQKSSIGLHVQNSGNDINFVVSGNGRALVRHYYPKGSSRMIENTGSEDLVLYTVVQEL